MRPLTMTTKNDLRNWVDSALGSEGNDQLTEAVTDWMCKQPDSPAWGTDWREYLERHDVWDIVTGLGL